MDHRESRLPLRLSGNGRHFRVRAPVQAMNIYAVEVSGTVGSYTPMVTLAAVEAIGDMTGASLPVTGSTSAERQMAIVVTNECE